MNKSNLSVDIKTILQKYLKFFVAASGCIALVIVLFYIIFVSKGFYHSDCTDTILWAQAMLDGGTIINPEFNYAAILPFGGQIIMLPFVAIFGYGMKAQIMGMVLFALLFTVALVYFLKSINMSWRWVSVAVAAVLLFTCSSEKLREIFWCHIIYYSLGVLFLLVGLGLVLNMLKQDKISLKYHVFLFLWTTLCSINGSQSLTLYTAPVIVAIIAERFFDTDTPFWSRKNAKHGIVILNMVVAVIVGLAIAKIITGSVTAEYQTKYSGFDEPEKWVSNLMNFIPAMLSLCGIEISDEPIFSVEGLKILVRIVGMLIVIITPYVMMCKYKKFKEREYRLMIIVHAVLSGLLLVGWVFGKLNDANWRLTPIVVTSVILCVMMICKLYKQGQNFRFAMLIIIPMTVLMGMYVSEIHLANCRKQSFQNERLESIAEYLKKEGLEYGYASFWNSNIITLMTDTEVFVAPIVQGEGNLVASDYQSDENWYDTDEYEEYFVLLTKSEFDAYEMCEHYIMPDRILNYEKHYILVYDYNVIAKLHEIYEEENEKKYSTEIGD